MDNCITSLLSYPFTHISQIKKLSAQQLYLKSTPLYPAYPFFLITSAISNLILSAWMIYFFIHSDIHYCYSGVTLGIQILACIYPLYQLMMFLILLVAIAKAQYTAVKILIMLCFTIILTSFGFGGLGVVFSCMVHSQDPKAIPQTFLTQNYFIQIIVYCMLVFVLLYLILVPISVWLQDRRDKNKQRTGCECCLLLLYIMFQVLLFIGFVVFMAIAIGGVPVLFYLLNGISKTQPMVQQVFYGMAISSIVCPYGVFGIVFLLSKFIGCGGEQEMEVLDESKEMKTQPSQRESYLKGNKVGSIYDQDYHKRKSMNLDDYHKRKSINLDDQIMFDENTKRESLLKNGRKQVLLQSHLDKDFGQQEFMSRKSQNMKRNTNKSVVKK